MITPMEIHNKEFKRKMRGYDQDEVDEFLDIIVIDYEKLYRENAELKDKINLQNEKMRHYIELEKTIQNTLLMAQKASEDAESNAKEKATIILKDAKLQAENIIKDANNQVILLEKNKEELIKNIKVFKAKVKSILETQMEILNEIDNSGDFPDIKLEEIDNSNINKEIEIPGPEFEENGQTINE
ncbi:MAG TPA: DivIVA domain-containing protein [Eubacteriaceae bacterium]|nr:DivIVA domain-containing protein [Eubacteriaceae bacterium]